MVTLFVSLFVFTMDLNRIRQTKYPGYKSFAKFISDIPKSLNLDYLFKRLSVSSGRSKFLEDRALHRVFVATL